MFASIYDLDGMYIKSSVCHLMPCAHLFDYLRLRSKERKSAEEPLALGESHSSSTIESMNFFTHWDLGCLNYGTQLKVLICSVVVLLKVLHKG